jgi:serine/threonine protein kinase
MPLTNMIPASVGRANSRRTRRPSQRRASSRYSAMECSQEFGKSVDFDISVDFGKSADLGRSNNEFNCSQDFHRSQEFGRDRTLSTQGSSSEDDRDICDTETGPNNSRRRKAQSSRSRQTSSNDVSDACPVTGHHSNILADYYIFPTVLGKGHYGCVRECMHRKTKQFYAVKSIEKQKIGRLDHLQREVYLLSKINHKGIMKMVDIFEDVEFVHIVTEKYVGGELFDRIIDYTTEQGCFDEIAAGTIVKSLLESVAYLHRNGIVHRDIKPENVLFISEDEEDLTVKLIDFGLARRHKKGDALMSNPVGTAYYMSPELLKGKYDQACDVWSTGIVAYILLCGYPPFNGDTDPDIFEAIKQASFNFPSQAWGHVSPEAKDFIKCLLRKDPRKRFTAEEALKHPWIRNLDRYYKQQREAERAAASSSRNRSREELLNVMRNLNLHQAHIRH